MPEKVKRMTDIQIRFDSANFDYYLRSNLWNEHKTSFADSISTNLLLPVAFLMKNSESFDWCLPSGGFRGFWIRSKTDFQPKSPKNRCKGTDHFERRRILRLPKPDDHLRISTRRPCTATVEGLERSGGS